MLGIISVSLRRFFARLQFEMARLCSCLEDRGSGVRLISRNENQFKSFPSLCEGLARDLRGRRCVLDGEIVYLCASNLRGERSDDTPDLLAQVAAFATT